MDVVTQRNTRPTKDEIRLLDEIKEWTSSEDYDYYLNFGGLGDLLLVLSACWNNSRTRLLFFCNGGSIPLVNDFLDHFKISRLIHPNIMGKKLALNIYELVKNRKTFKTSGHLADWLNYGDWIRDNKYKNRIIRYAPWKNMIGAANINKPYVVLAPSGSSRNVRRQRYLTKVEYNRFVEKLNTKGLDVYSIGSDSDYTHFGLPSDNSYWLTSKCLRNKGNVLSEHGLDGMLKIVHGAQEVFSVDTWLKTYTLLIEIPTTVILTRWYGTYKRYGTDSSDYIFLNPSIWNLKTITAEELLR